MSILDDLRSEWKRRQEHACSNPREFLRRARERLDADNLSGAQEDLEEVIRGVLPTIEQKEEVDTFGLLIYSQAKYHLGNLSSIRGNNEDAIAHWSDAIGHLERRIASQIGDFIQPHLIKLYRSSADLLEREMQKADEAIRYYSLALCTFESMSPEGKDLLQNQDATLIAEILLRRGMLYGKKGEENKATKDFWDAARETNDYSVAEYLALHGALESAQYHYLCVFSEIETKTFDSLRSREELQKREELGPIIQKVLGLKYAKHIAENN